MQKVTGKGYSETEEGVESATEEAVKAAKTCKVMQRREENENKMLKCTRWKAKVTDLQQSTLM